MANKRLNDLPEETDPAADDFFAVDGATTRKSKRSSVLGTNLEAVRGLTSAADKGIQFTGTGTAATYDLTAAGKALLDDADATAQQVTLGLVPGTNVQAYDADLAALAANSTAGLWTYTGAGTGAARTLTAPAAGITITNPAGTAGNPTLVLANDLAAVEGLSSTGIARRTGTDTWTVGTTVSNAELAPMAAYTIKGNATGSSAAPTDISIAALTLKASPVSGDIVLIQDSAASNAFKKTTVGALASAGSVASIAGNTGAFTISGLLANSTNDLRVLAASKSDQQTATSSTVAVTPAHQQDHDSAVKAWAVVTQSGGTYTLAASYNVTSISKTSTGVIVVTLTTPFSSSVYGVEGTLSQTTAATIQEAGGNRTTSTFEMRIQSVGTTPALMDSGFFCKAMGRQ